MANRDDTAAGDPLLAPFLAAGSDEAAQPILSDLLARAAAPLVRRVVRGHVATRDGDGAADGEDVEHTVLLRLTQQLWRQRGGEEPPISNLAAYVTRSASNACYERLRERRPQRARLQSRLRYVFRHDRSLALWERRDGGWACGAAAWRGREPVLAWADVAQWRGRLAVPAGAERQSDAARLVRLAGAIVEALGAPARLEDVVTLAADALGIADDPEPPAIESGEFARPAATLLADPGSAADVRLDQRRFLERVWAEIGALPVRQRVALLLNLAGPASQDMLSLLPATGVASWGAIAEVLEMDAGRLETLVPGLPQDDHAIAGLLQVTRRQVINLRKCARERLARRLGLGRRGDGGAQR